MIRITCEQDGFRRAGMAHPKGASEYPDDHFSEDQLVQLQAEPKLTVEIVEDKKLSEAELIAAIGQAESPEAIAALLPKGEKRKKVKEAAEKRAEELAKA